MKPMAKPLKLSEKKLIALAPEMVEAIKEFRFSNRIDTESEAIRQLISIGLRADKELHELLRNMDSVADAGQLHKGKLENKLRFVLSDNSDIL